MSDPVSVLRWILVYPVAVLASALASLAVYLALWASKLIPGMPEVPVLRLLAIVGAAALGAHVFVTVSARIAPTAHSTVAWAACGLVVLAALACWSSLPSAAAWPMVLPSVLGAVGGVAAIAGEERGKARREGARQADQPPREVPPQP